MTILPKRYVKRPDPITAVKFDGLFTHMQARELAHWCEGTFVYDSMPGNEEKRHYWSIRLTVSTQQSRKSAVHAIPGDWIAQGEDGEFFVIPQEDFEAQYDEDYGY